jgi:hypothetical protein
MAKTAAEYQKAYRERKKANVEKSVDQSLKFIRKPLSDYLGEAGFDFEGSLHWYGVDLSTSNWVEAYERVALDGGREAITPLERLEGLAAGFHDAAVELATFINAYKTEEARSMREELLGTRYETPEAQRAALEKIKQIDAVIEALSRRHRLLLPVIGTNVA